MDKSKVSAITFWVVLIACIAAALTLGIINKAYGQESHEDNPYDHATIAQLYSPSGVILLLAGSFECAKKKMKRAVNVNLFGSTWLGCYSMSEDKIHIDWEDGDSVDLDPHGGIVKPKDQVS